MTQQRLNHCKVFRIHQERMGALDLMALLKNLLKQMRGGLLFSEIFNQNIFGLYLNLLTCYNEFIKSFKSFSVYYPNISVAVQKRT